MNVLVSLSQSWQIIDVIVHALKRPQLSILWRWWTEKSSENLILEKVSYFYFHVFSPLTSIFLLFFNSPSFMLHIWILMPHRKGGECTYGNDLSSKYSPLLGMFSIWSWSLTHFSPVSHFYFYFLYFYFLTLSRGTEMKYWAKMD